MVGFFGCFLLDLVFDVGDYVGVVVVWYDFVCMFDGLCVLDGVDVILVVDE